MFFMRRVHCHAVTCALLGSALFALTPALVAQTASIAQPARWDTPLPTAAVIGARADTLVNKLLLAFGPIQRAEIARDFARFAASPKGESAEHVRSAAYLAAGYDNLALMYAADAVRRNPANGLSVGNYGALLYSKDGPAAALETLRYAYDVAPKTLSIVVTLANVALVLRDGAHAKPFLDQALRIDGESGEALLGMGVYWMQKNDPKSAFPYFAKAGGVTYQRNVDIMPKPRDGDGDVIPPPQPIEAPMPPSGAAGGAEESSGGARSTGLDIEFAPSPNWESPDALVAARVARQAYSEWFADQVSASLDKVREATGRMLKSKKYYTSYEPGVTPMQDMNTNFARSRNDDWLNSEVKKAMKDFYDVVKPGLEKLTSAPQLAPPPRASGSGDIQAEAAAFAASVRKSCQDAHSLLTGQWQVIKSSESKLFDDVNIALKRYYRAQGTLIRRIQDPGEYDAAVATRDGIVLAQYLGLLMTEDGIRMAMALSIAAGGTESSTQCPGEPGKAPPSYTGSSDKPELAPPPQAPCPFRNSPIDLSAKIESLDIGAEFKLDCESAKFGGSAGPFSASRTRVFKTKTVIDFKAEVEKKASGTGVSTGSSISARATGTIQIVRTDAGSETMTTGIELEGKAVVAGIAEASITGSLTSTAYEVKAPARIFP